MKELKVVLIMPGRSSIGNIGGRNSKPWIPPGLFDVAAIMRKAHPDIDIVVMDELAGDIVTEKSLPDADLYGIGGLSTSRLRAFEIADLIHETRDGKVILGGMDVTASYWTGDKERFLSRFDAIVIGLFPVETCRELLSDLEVGRLKDVYLSDPARVDEWVLPAYDLIDPKRYVVPYAPQFSRGCPFNCHFCTVNAMCQKAVIKPPELVARELDMIPPWPILVAKDDCFGIDYTMTVESVLPLVKQRGGVLAAELPAKWLLGTETRPPLLETMAENGTGIFYIGVENLKPIGSKSLVPEGYEEVVTRAHKAGSMVIGSFTIGSRSDDTAQSFLDTVKWSIISGFDVQQYSNIAALPGSKLRAIAEREGTIADYNPEHYNGVWPTVIHENLSPKECIEILAEAYRLSYSRMEICRKILRLPSLIWRRPELLGLAKSIYGSLSQIRTSAKLVERNTGYEIWLRTRWPEDRVHA